MYLSYKELEALCCSLQWQKNSKLRTSEGITEECYFCFKVFSYTEAGHRKRFEQCVIILNKGMLLAVNPARYREEAFPPVSTSQLNALTDEKEVQSSGLDLFCVRSFADNYLSFLGHAPPQYLATDYVTPSCGHSPVSDGEFIYLYDHTLKTLDC